MGKKIGIDFGSTYSCLCYVDDKGEVRIVDNLEGDRTTPSVVFFDPDGSVVVGISAKDAEATYPECLATSVKYYLGNPDYKFFAYGKEYSAIDVATLILKKLVADAELYIDEEIEGAVITCPVYFGEEARDALKKASENVILSNGSHLKVFEILDDPTAAAIAYENYRHEDMDKTVLVYDLGGGSFDCTVMKLSLHGDKRQMQIIATNGNHRLGGIDWDAALNELVCQKYNEITGADINEMKNDPELVADLDIKIEKLKKHLTRRDSSSIIVSYDGRKERIEVTKAEFDRVTSGLLEQTISLVNDMLAKKGFSMTADIDEILLVGGSACMPQVAERLKVEYDKVITAYEPNFSIAMGAALVANGYSVSVNRDNFVRPIPDHYDVWSDSVYGIVLEIGARERVVNLIDKCDSLPKQVGCSERGVDVFYRKTGAGNEVFFTVVKFDYGAPDTILDYETGYAEIKIKFKQFLADKAPLDVRLYIDANRLPNSLHKLEDKLIVTNKLNNEVCSATINWRTRAYVGAKPAMDKTKLR